MGALQDGGRPPGGFKLIAILVGVGSIGVQILFPLVFAKLPRGVGLGLIALCATSLIIAFSLHLFGRRRAVADQKRQWAVVGFGQGWIEARVRNNAGNQLTVSFNAGDGADQIHINVAFRKRARPRQSDYVELIFQIDDAIFEWDVLDEGHANLELRGQLWWEVEAIKEMLEKMRHGERLNVAVPQLQFTAEFTLEGAFDVLHDAAKLGEPHP